MSSSNSNEEDLRGGSLQRASSSHLEAIVETAHEGIITIDRDGIVQMFNDAAERMFEYEREEVIGHNISMLMPQPHRDRHDSYIERYLETGDAHIIDIGREVEGLKKNGETFPLHLAVSEFEDEGDLFFAGFIRDLTEQKRLEREVRQVQKMEAIGTLTTGVAHDFNNVLMGISGHAQMALAKLDEDHPAREHIESAKLAVARGAGLTNRLLTFTRRENGEGRPLAPDRAIADVESLLRPLVSNDIDFTIELGAEEARIQCEPGHLDQILLNLVVNARDASEAGGRVSVETDVADIRDYRSLRVGHLYPGRYFVIEVSDDGEGIDEQTLQQIFDPFFTTKPVGEGTGLGLSTVYGIIQQWNGAIDVESQPGEGTTFRVYFDILDDAPKAGTRRPALSVETPVAEGDGERILVVDDDPQARRAIRQYLEHGGYQSLGVDSGEEALRAAREDEELDAAVVDLDLGSERGAKIAKQLRSERETLPFIFVSGYSDLVGHDELLETENPVLEKPFSEDTLLAAIDRALEAKRGAPTDESEQPGGATPTDRPLRVLVVEDDELARHATCELLAQEGYVTDETGCGEEALDQIDEDDGQVDVAVVDLTLPDCAGTDLAERLRERTDELPIVFVSGVDPEDPDVAAALEEPRTMFLQKPIDIDRLVSSIGSVQRSG